MANAKAGVHVLTLRPPDIPDYLIKGERVYKFDDVETGSSGAFVILRTDPRATILYWADMRDNTKMFIDFSDVLDVRFGKYGRAPQKVSTTSFCSRALQDGDRARDQLAGSFVIPSSGYDQSLLTVVTGCNFSEPKFATFVASSPQSAEVSA